MKEKLDKQFLIFEGLLLLAPAEQFPPPDLVQVRVLISVELLAVAGRGPEGLHPLTGFGEGGLHRGSSRESSGAFGPRGASEVAKVTLLPLVVTPTLCPTQDSMRFSFSCWPAYRTPGAKRRQTIHTCGSQATGKGFLKPNLGTKVKS